MHVHCLILTLTAAAVAMVWVGTEVLAAWYIHTKHEYDLHTSIVPGPSNRRLQLCARDTIMIPFKTRRSILDPDCIDSYFDAY